MISASVIAAQSASYGLIWFFHVMEETFMRDIVALVSPALHGLAESLFIQNIINGLTGNGLTVAGLVSVSRNWDTTLIRVYTVVGVL